MNWYQRNKRNYALRMMGIAVRNGRPPSAKPHEVPIYLELARRPWR